MFFLDSDLIKCVCEATGQSDLVVYFHILINKTYYLILSLLSFIMSGFFCETQMGIGGKTVKMEASFFNNFTVSYNVNIELIITYNLFIFAYV